MESQPSERQELAEAAGRSAASPSRRLRLYAGLALLGCVGLLGLAAWLTPDARGYGTHQQLGLGECGMLITTGLPCPTCGMTTAFAYTVRGRLIAAFLAQPAGCLLALATVACAIGSGWVVVTGRLPAIRLPIITPYRFFLGLLVLLVGSWALKIALGLANGTLPDRG